jgi:hypothetical protein
MYFVLHINLLLFSYFNQVGNSGHILLQTLLNVKFYPNASSKFRVSWDWQNEGGMERNADGWADMEMQAIILQLCKRF